MQKYWHVINIGIQGNLTYRFNYLTRTLFGFIPLLAMIQIWQAIYSGRSGEAIGGYTIEQMISYYLIKTVVDALTGVYEDDWQISGDIRDGAISQFLLKPIDYLWYRFSLFIAGRLSYLLVSGLPMVIFIALMHQYFIMPASAGLFGWFLVSTFLTAILQFLMSYTMAMLAFWVLEVSTFIFILYAFEYIASGQMFPLDLLPAGVMNVVSYTPFPYQLFFPVSIYMGHATGAALWRGLIVQFVWVLIAYGLARLLWRRGVRHYSAVGG